MEAKLAGGTVRNEQHETQKRQRSKSMRRCAVMKEIKKGIIELGCKE